MRPIHPDALSAWKTLQKTLLGKTILFTDQTHWSDEQIVRTYRSQAHVESAFRAMKNPHYLSFRPTYHWTDQKLRVHALYCLIALITSLLHRQLARADVRVSLARRLERLADIREVSLVYHDAGAKAPQARTTLSETDDEQQTTLVALDLMKFRAA